MAHTSAKCYLGFEIILKIWQVLNTALIKLHMSSFQK